MTNLLDIYNFINELETKIGDGCRVMLFKAFDDTFAIQVNWMEDLHYRWCFSIQELKYIKDIKIASDWFAIKAKREYMLATVGEE